MFNYKPAASPFDFVVENLTGIIYIYICVCVYLFMNAAVFKVDERPHAWSHPLRTCMAAAPEQAKAWENASCSVRPVACQSNL